jgi:DNA-binding transcriptional regulator LsrR (DeoR family)
MNKPMTMADFAALENEAMRERCGLARRARPKERKKRPDTQAKFLRVMGREPMTARQIAAKVGVGVTYCQGLLKRMAESGAVKVHQRPGNEPWLYEVAE